MARMSKVLRRIASGGYRPMASRPRSNQRRQVRSKHDSPHQPYPGHGIDNELSATRSRQSRHTAIVAIIEDRSAALGTQLARSHLSVTDASAHGRNKRSRAAEFAGRP